MKTKFLAFLFALAMANIVPFTTYGDETVIDGVTWYYSVENGEATITRVSEVGSELVVPSTVGNNIPVTAIGPSVCQYNGSITSVTIPDSIQSIGYMSFYNCYTLESLEIGAGLESLGERVFDSCRQLATVVVDAGNAAFTAENNILYDKGKTRFVLVPGTVTEVEIPAAVAEIDAALLQQFRGLSSLTVAAGSATYSAQNNVLYNADKTLLIIAPGSLTGTFEIPATVTEIAVCAFSQSKISGIEFPSGLKTIGDGAFYECDSLTAIELPESIETIAADAFSSCDRLANVTLGGVKDIGDNAFLKCPSLEAIDIPNTTTNIGGSAFANCNELASVHIGSGVKKIGTGLPRDEFGNLVFDDENPLPLVIGAAFAPCHKLLNFTLEPGNETFDCYDGCLFYKNTPNNAKTLAVYPSGRADLYFNGVTVTEIGESACAMCDNFGEITVTNSVRNIAEEAFIACSQIYKLTVPEGITNIAYGAFALSLNLVDVEIAGSVKSIGDKAFMHDYMPDDRWENPVIGRLVLHNGIEYIGVDSFSGGPVLGDIIIPDSVTTLGEGAFSCWERMTRRIIIGSGLTEISASAFEGSNNLTELVIGENVKVIGDSAFKGCTSIRTLNIPEGVTWIGDYAFYDCISLCALNLPSSVTHIGEYAFGTYNDEYKKSAVKSARTLLGAAPESANYTYGGCEDLRRVLIPQGVEYIGDGAFGGVTSENLRKVYLPTSLKPNSEEDIDAYLENLFPGQDFTASDVTWYEDEKDLKYATITYDMNFEGGETASEQVLDYLDALPVPSRAGYSFAGWWTTSDDSGETVDLFRSFDEDATLYAHWVESPLTFGDDAPWMAVYDDTREGWVFQSGDVAFGYTSSAYMTVTGPCIVSFSYKNLQYGWEDTNPLKVLVDGEEVASYGVSDNWTVVDYEQVEAGEHTVTWLYENKNGSFSDYAQLADFAVESATPRTVTFVLDGGTMSEATERIVLRSVGKMPRPSKDTFIFGGWWTTADDSGKRVNSGDWIENDVTLYAHWIAAPFSAGGDKGWLVESDGCFKSETLEYGEQIYAEVRYTGPCRVAFDWKAATSYWSNNSFEFFIDGERKKSIQGNNGGGASWRSESFDIEGEGEHIIRWVFEYDDEFWGNYGNPENCVWLRNVAVGTVCAVTFDPNYEGAKSDTQMLLGVLGELPVPERDDYFAFTGWFTLPEGGEKVTSETPVTGAVTYYAHWKSSPFKFEGEWYEDEDGSWRSAGTESYTSCTAVKEVEGPCTVSFKWKAHVSQYNSVTIDDIVNNEYTTVTNLYNSSIYMDDWEETTLTIADGSTHTIRFEFYTGWMPSEYYYLALKDVTVTPLASYTLTFDLNYDDAEAVTRRVPQDGAVVGNPPSVWRSGYAVNGWWTDPTGGERITAATQVSADTTYYAHWVECPFTFNGKPWEMGPDGEWCTAKMDTYSYDYGATFTVQGPCRVTFDWKKAVGYSGRYMQLKLDGQYNSSCDSTEWETKTVTFAENGSHTIYWDAYVNSANSETTVDNCFMVRNVTVTKIIPCVVTLNPNYTGGEATTRNVMTGDAIGELPSATRSGYAFVGWFTAAEGGTQITAETVVSATMTVYAHWIEATSFDSTGGGANWSVEADGSWKSGTIKDSQSTWAEVTVAGPCRVSFKWKTSSESGYDKLHLYVDGSTEDYVSPISGTGADWAEVVFALADSGSHTVRWTYSKDGSQSSGSDCGWVKDFLAISPEPSAPEANVDTDKLDEQITDKLDSLDVEMAEETGVRTIAVKEGETLTQEEVAAIAESIVIEAAIAGSSEKVDTSAGYDVNYDTESNEIVITLKTPEMDTTVQEANKEEGDSTGMLANLDKVELSTEEPTPSEEDVAAGNTEVAALPVKAVRGLYYQASWGSSLEGMTEGQKVQATGSSLNLGVIKQKGSSGFYKLSVSEK